MKCNFRIIEAYYPGGFRINRVLEIFQWKGGKSFLWQGICIAFSVLYIAGLHLSNDGLWFQGDSPRHAANGLFWWDFLTSFSLNPLQFSLSYYARYPVIHPTGYPPLFYLIEGAVFFIFGASPFIAKGLVLAFALLAGFYAAAWLRRWIAKEAGWGGALLILQPEVIRWANAIMLNVPAMALGLATIYHARRWIESPSSRHIYPTAIYALLGILTYVHNIVMLFVVLALIIFKKQWMILWDRRVLIVSFIGMIVLLPWAIVIFKWAPVQLTWVATPIGILEKMPTWTYYLKQMKTLCTIPLVILAILGVAVGLFDSRWRKEVKWAVIWFIVGYFFLSYIMVREGRYALHLIPPVVFLCCIGLFSLMSWNAVCVKKVFSRLIFSGMAVLVLFHFSAAAQVKVPYVKGFKDVVTFLDKMAPEKIIFYDGIYDGVFTFYLRSGDPKFKKGVVLGNKLLYASSIFRERKLIEKVTSVEDVVEVFRNKCGSEWLVIEGQLTPDKVTAAKFLRQALSRPEFKFVKSFPVITPIGATQLDVYRFLAPFENPSELEIPFPSLGKGTSFRIKPIEKSSQGFKY